MNERIKQLRKTLNYTQQQFANKLGVKRNTVAQWEMGINNLTDVMIKSICREFNVNEDWLRNGNGEIFTPTPSSILETLTKEYGLSHSAYVLTEKFIKLNPEIQKEILNYLADVVVTLANFSEETLNPLETDVSKLSIDERVNLYRKELEREEKVVEKSEVC